MKMKETANSATKSDFDIVQTVRELISSGGPRRYLAPSPFQLLARIFPSPARLTAARSAGADSTIQHVRDVLDLTGTRRQGHHMIKALDYDLAEQVPPEWEDKLEALVEHLAGFVMQGLVKG